MVSHLYHGLFSLVNNTLNCIVIAKIIKSFKKLAARLYRILDTWLLPRVLTLSCPGRRPLTSKIVWRWPEQNRQQLARVKFKSHVRT